MEKLSLILLTLTLAKERKSHSAWCTGADTKVVMAKLQVPTSSDLIKTNMNNIFTQGQPVLRPCSAELRIRWPSHLPEVVIRKVMPLSPLPSMIWESLSTMLSFSVFQILHLLATRWLWTSKLPQSTIRTLYTDSNGLGMQERVLNYRPSYDITIKDGGLNITANYYPVVSAIAIRDPET